MTEKEFHGIFGKLHWYALMYRGVSPGCMPNGAADSDLSFGSKGYGAVGYREPLTTDQLYKYELKSIGFKNWEDLQNDRN
ncbi:hypothetical protein ACLUXD_02110 [Loigolactobacillus coryniformis subsp. coryniformis]|uniref:defense against restriction DarA-related protein n=1 Tax=Loigolactobacillus coryniformis TaxID=1610 RepID=UPI000FEEEDCC|nr:MAG: hypothetical protein DUD28_02775 [Lactobacillus sp.]